jgi:uncharacterized protein YceH (UPF0502 family)
MLDRTELRILGVLIEKERTVPDTYPMSENALVDGCNQKNNRDPVMEVQPFQLAGALMSLQEKGWIGRLDGVSRVTKYRHKVVERLGLRDHELAVLAELLVRGPQAPGALKPRVQRMGYTAEPDQIEATLRAMAGRPQPLVEQLSLAPRERDRRWRHLLGNDSDVQAESPAAPESVPAVAPAAPVAAAGDLAARVARLESEVAALKTALAELRGH